MNTKQRIPFGSEQTMKIGKQHHCSACHVTLGNQHKAGCNEEECPSCGGFIIGCGCNCLSTLDAALIIQALYGKFTDLDRALQTVNLLENNRQAGTSYLVHSAMQYLFEHIDDKSRAEIAKKIHISFPILKPTMYDKNGVGFYTTEQLAKAFDVTVEEINSRIEALSSAGFVIKKSERENLQKSH